MSAKGDYYPAGANMFVPNMTYAADCFLEGKLYVDLSTVTAPALTASATGILSATSIATAGNTSTFVAAFVNSVAQMCKFGRALQYVASGAATSSVTVTGFDYLGQPFIETITLNGTTAVNGNKCFRRVSNVAWGATAAVTINVGWRDCYGLPYAYIGDGIDYTIQVRNSSQGTFTAYVATQTATSGDPRGSWVPNASFIANGTRYWEVTYEPLRGNLYGPRHVTS